MTEPKKLAIVLLVVMAIGLVALAVEWLKSRISGWLLLLVLSFFLLALALTIHPIHAQEHRGHPPEHQALHEKFYSTWFMPDAPKTSCCDKQDCAPAASRFANGHWEAEHGGSWVQIPNRKIELNRDSPDGRSHLCGRRTISGDFIVFCFIAGNGT